MTQFTNSLNQLVLMLSYLRLSGGLFTQQHTPENDKPIRQTTWKEILIVNFIIPKRLVMSYALVCFRDKNRKQQNKATM